MGTGSGYAAAILGRLAQAVYTVERIESLATAARARFVELGIANVHILHGDGSLGWLDHAPYEAIAVAAGGPKVPQALLSQLTIGGRLVIPVGTDPTSQMLIRVTRRGEAEFIEENLAEVCFVPLVGEQGWKERARVLSAPDRSRHKQAISELVREAAEPLPSLAASEVDAIVERVGDARLVLLGESTHGTSEFYRMRARISEKLIRRRGFQFVAVEADWPDAARVNTAVRGDEPHRGPEFTPFERFPTWMWRNEEVADFVGRLRALNAERPNPRDRIGFHGLDLYSLFTSLAAVLAYLDEVDPTAAKVARARYAALTPWQKDPAAYGKAVLVGRYQSSEHAVVAMLRDMLERRLEYAAKDGVRFFDAVQNVRTSRDRSHPFRGNVATCFA